MNTAIPAKDQFTESMQHRHMNTAIPAKDQFTESMLHRHMNSYSC